MVAIGMTKEATRTAINCFGVLIGDSPWASLMISSWGYGVIPAGGYKAGNYRRMSGIDSRQPGLAWTARLKTGILPGLSQMRL
jgi:hypothetical protein